MARQLTSPQDEPPALHRGTPRRAVVGRRCTPSARQTERAPSVNRGCPQEAPGKSRGPASRSASVHSWAGRVRNYTHLVHALRQSRDRRAARMTPLRRLTAVTAAAVMTCGAVSCTKDDPGSTPSPTASSASTSATPTATATATASPTPTPTPTKSAPVLTPRAQAAADAVAMVEKYYSTLDALSRNPPPPPATKAALSTAASGTQLAIAQRHCR